MTRIVVNPDCLANVVRGWVALEDVNNRQVGKTTSAVLRAIADAHAHPGVPVPVRDPDLFTNQLSEVLGRCSPERARHVRQAAETIIARLALTRVVVTCDPHTNMPSITSNFATVI